MSEKYCPAGKIECKHYNGGSCYGGWHNEFVLNMQQCPWPSRQVRENNLSKIFGAIPDMPEYVKQNPYADGYSAGFRACQEKAVEAVENISVCNDCGQLGKCDPHNTGYYSLCLDAIGFQNNKYLVIAAIEAVREEEG